MAEPGAPGGDRDRLATDAPSGGRHSPRERVTPFRALLVVLVVAALGVSWVLTRPTGTSYRTASVATGAAVATLAAVGTITPVQQAELTFPVAGTVGTVDVAVGQQVAAGQVLATLDAASFQTAVVAAEATLASAQESLASDEAAQAAAASGTTSGATSSATSAAGSAAGGSAASGPQVAKLQATLVADQKHQDAAAAAAGAALAAATTVCTAASPPAGQTSTPTAVGASSTTPAAGAGAAGAGGPGGGGAGGSGGGTPQTCTEALAAASSAQAALVAAIATVTHDEAALAAALGLGGPSSGTGPGGGGAGTTTTTTTTVPTSAPSHNSGSGATSSAGRTRTVTPEQLALDQADVDVAQAALDTAQQNVGDGNLVSPLAGTVGALALVVGQSVTAGAPSSTPQVVVIGSGSDYQVTTAVPVTAVAAVAIGQSALVTPDSSPAVLHGTVTGVGVLGTSTGTTTTYPVTIAVQSSELGQFSGASASVAIVTRSSVGVTTVPTSAVRTTGTIHLVTVVDGSTAKAVRVTIGTVGAQRTQILSGVTDGELVSLADLAAPVPTSSTTTRGGLAGIAGVGGLSGGGGFGGGGFGGGGFARTGGG